jgi:hypothetical protein
MSDRTQRVRISEARSKMGGVGTPTMQSKLRFDEIIGRFEKFAERGFGAKQIDEITADIASQFVHAMGSNGKPPSVRTTHIRRSALRLLFRTARLEFGADGDPTADLVLPPKTKLTARPLTEDEVAVGRSYSLHTMTATRQPAAWALCEATATTAELPHITTDDLDLDNANGPRVWLHGSYKREPRWGLLDDWGAAQLRRRALALVGTDRLIYAGTDTGHRGQISACIAIKETLIRCGLDKEADVRPASLVAWAGRVALEETGSIEGVALRLGFRSLDSAATFINYTWR